MSSDASVVMRMALWPMDRAELDDPSGKGVLVQAGTSDNMR